MENILLLLASHLVGRNAEPKFKRYRIGQTGCTSLLLSGRPQLHIHSTADGERVYFYEEETGDITYGLITVHMKNLCSLPKAEAILIHYLNRIRKPFRICWNTGMETEIAPGLTGLGDYWQDEDGMDWKISGRSNGRILAVLYVKNIGNITVAEQDAFLNSFRFSLQG